MFVMPDENAKAVDRFTAVIAQKSEASEFQLAITKTDLYIASIDMMKKRPFSGARG